MTEDEQFYIERLKERLTHEHQHLLVQLNSELKNLQVRVKNAIESLKDGHALDVHLIVSAGGITELITRWNLARDLIPYLHPQLAKKANK